MKFPVNGIVWLWQGDSAWHFVTLAQEIADEIRDLSASVPRGFGSVRVRVTIGETTWSTSVFPDKESGSFIFPLKKEVREREGITAGMQIQGVLEPVFS